MNRIPAIASLVVLVPSCANEHKTISPEPDGASCVFEKKTCGQKWKCGKETYEFSLQEFPTLAWPENIYHYKCNPSLSESEIMKKWHEYQEKRDYKTLCKDIESGLKSIELTRAAEFCNWRPFKSSKTDTNCRAPANTTMQFQYQLKPHWVTGNHVFEGKEVPALFNLNDGLRQCGPHVFTFTYVWKMCTWHFTLRYDATSSGLVHGSLLGTNTCNYPDTYAYYFTDIVTLWPSP